MDSKDKWPEITALIDEALEKGDGTKFEAAKEFIKSHPESHEHFYFYLINDKDVKAKDVLNLLEWDLPRLKILYDDNSSRISPALDFVRDEDSEKRFAVLTTEITTESLEKIGGELIYVHERSPLIVTSRGDVLEANEVSLSKLGLFARTLPSQALRRWHPRDVKDFSDRVKSGTIIPPETHKVFGEIRAAFTSYVYYDEPVIYDFISTYIIATYFYPLFQAFPLLVLYGPKQSGKTLTLQMIEHLAFNAMLLTDPTPAIIFRSIEELGPTLLLDEIESLANRRDYSGSIMSMLRASYKRIDVPRMEERPEGGFKLRLFSCYGPKVIGTIQGVEDVLANRSIILVMLRRKPEDEKLFTRTDPALEEDRWWKLRNKLYLLIMTRWEELNGLIKQTIKELEGKLSNRELELWTPILSIANWIDQSLKNEKKLLFDGLLEMALAKSDERKMQDKETNQTVMVLQALLALFQEERESNWVSSLEIREQLEKFYSEPQGWMNETWIGRLMSRIGITRTCRIKRPTEFIGEKRLTHYYINPEWLKDYCDRYGADLSEPDDEGGPPPAI